LPSKKLPKFYLIDSVTKYVGGRYIDMFMRYLKPVFSPAFRESPNTVKKKMLTLLKTWYIYYPNEILNTIYNELGLATYEAQLLTPEDHKKIDSFIEGVKEERKKKKMNVEPVQIERIPPHQNMP